MKKYIVILAVIFMSSSMMAQENTKKVKQIQKGDLVEATYFYADGGIEQQGTFNKDGKLHGLWVSYDVKGNKVASGSYDNGHKVGKWTFWTEDSVKEVDFDKSKITNVVEKNKQAI